MGTWKIMWKNNAREGGLTYIVSEGSRYAIWVLVIHVNQESVQVKTLLDSINDYQVINQ